MREQWGKTAHFINNPNLRLERARNTRSQGQRRAALSCVITPDRNVRGGRNTRRAKGQYTHFSRHMRVRQNGKRETTVRLFALNLTLIGKRKKTPCQGAASGPGKEKSKRTDFWRWLVMPNNTGHKSQDRGPIKTPYPRSNVTDCRTALSKLELGM